MNDGFKTLLAGGSRINAGALLTRLPRPLLPTTIP